MPTTFPAHRQTSLLDEMGHHMTTTRTTAAISAVILIGVPVTGLRIASSAQAHDGGITATCTSLSANLSNYPGGSTIGGIVDGVDLGTSTFGPSFSQTLPLDPIIPHTWTITVKSGDGDSRYDFTKTGASDPACIPVVVPPVEEPPVITPPPVIVTEPRVQNYVDCLGGRFVLDNTASTTDVTYVVQGTSYVVPAGTATHTDHDGTLYQPYDGTYTITAGEQTWTFPTAGNCPTEEPTPPVVPPTDEPTEQPTVPVTPTQPSSPPATPGSTSPESTSPIPPSTLPSSPTAEPNAATTVSTITPTVSPVVQPVDALAYTGARDLTAWIALAAALIAAGIASKVVPILRRRKDTRA